jgi:hypothetical protein
LRWRSDNNGSGIVDIGISLSDTFTVIAVTDIIIGNMSIINTYNSTKVYTHTIKSENRSTRVWIVHCNVWAKGSDTVALWNPTSGVYYHAECNFKGGIDAVCPRGWCYAVNCQFYETANSAPIWHEGAAGTTQKFVLRKPYVDHDTTFKFKLVNGQKEYEIFLLDGLFSPKLKEPEVTAVVYYYNCHGIDKDTSWYANNLSKSPGSPKQSEITAKWTFKDAAEPWDPENEMPSVLPYSSLPQPWKGAYEIPSNVLLKWIKARDAELNAVYFGADSSSLQLVKTQTENSYQCTGLKSGTYYWRVDAVKGSSSVKGAVWSFTVDQNVPVVSELTLVNKNNGFNATITNDKLHYSYSLERSSSVSVALFDLQGKTVFVSPLSQKSAGVHNDRLSVNQNKLPAGRYIVQLKAGTIEQTANTVVQ